MRIFIISVLLLVINLGRAQSTFESTGVTSDWNTTTTWNETIALGDADGIPDKDDIVIILTGHSVDCGSTGFNETISLTVNAGGVLNLNSISTNQLRLWNNGGNFINNGTVNGPGLIRPIFSCTIQGAGVFNNVDLRKTNTNIYIDSDFTFEDITVESGADLIINSGSTLTLDGLLKSTSSASFFTNNGSLIINHSSFMTGIYGSSTNFLTSNGDLTINSTLDFPIPADNIKNITINGTVTLTGDVSVEGDFVNNSTFSFSGTPTITFNGSSSQSISGSGTSNLHNLTLNNSNGLSLNSGTINISNALTSTSGTITQNGANITLVSTSANTAGLVKLNTASDYSYSSGDFTVQRYYNGTEDGWRMVAAPIKSATLADWDDEFIYCGISGGIGNYSYSACGGFYSVYEYDESAANPGIDDGLSEVTSLAFGVSNATGTLIYTSSGVTTVSVTGTPEFDDIAKSITSVNDGWNLVANPYPSTLDWTNGSSGFYDDNSALIDNSRWVYSADAANYLSSTDDIPHTQGFWVKTSSGGNLNYSVNQTISSQANFTKSVNGINHPLRLKVTSDTNSYYDFAYVVSGPNYSNDYDQGKDIFKFFSPYPDYVPNIFFLDNQGNQLDRTCINNNQSENLQLQVNVGQFAPGNYTIQFENLQQFMIGSCLQLEDLHNGIITDLRQDSNYTFLSDTNAPNPRFLLHINVDYDINVSNAMCFNDSSAFVSIKGTNLHGHYFGLIDTSGMLIDSVVAVSDSILFSGLNAGVFQYETNHVGTCPTHNQLIYVTEPEEVISLFSTISDTFYLDTSNQISINFRNLSAGSTYYEWDLGDGNTSNNFSENHTYTSPGIYTVKLISKMDSIGTCVDEYEKMIYIIDPISTINNESNIDNLKFDVKNKVLHIAFKNNNQQQNKISIMDIQGKNILTKGVIGDIQIDLQHLKSGMYLVTIHNTSEASIFQSKFILN